MHVLRKSVRIEMTNRSIDRLSSSSNVTNVDDLQYSIIYDSHASTRSVQERIIACLVNPPPPLPSLRAASHLKLSLRFFYLSLTDWLLSFPARISGLTLTTSIYTLEFPNCFSLKTWRRDIGKIGPHRDLSPWPSRLSIPWTSPQGRPESYIHGVETNICRDFREEDSRSKSRIYRSVNRSKN